MTKKKNFKIVFKGKCKNCPFGITTNFEVGKKVTISCPYGGIREFNQRCNIGKG